jgi:hypothetical protein
MMSIIVAGIVMVMWYEKEERENPSHPHIPPAPTTDE